MRIKTLIRLRKSALVLLFAGTGIAGSWRNSIASGQLPDFGPKAAVINPALPVRPVRASEYQALAQQRQQFTPQPNLEPRSGPFGTPVTDGLFDPAAIAEWVDGAQHPLLDPAGLTKLVWTQTAGLSAAPLKFGASNQPGVRYLRLGFKQAILVGTILTRGGGSISVLRPGAAYAGNLSEDSQWIPATRMVDGRTSTAEVQQNNYALWSLPAGTSTRAIRFTHVATPTDSNFAGVIEGIYVLTVRYANIASQAAVFTSANRNAAPLLVNEQYDGWKTWDNGPDFQRKVSASSPEWIILSWPRAIPVAGLAALWAGFDAADVQMLSAAEGVNPQSAPESAWRSIGQPYKLLSQYPRSLIVDWMDFGKPVTTRALRLRMTAVTDENHHPHLVGKTKNGTRIWLDDLMALEPLQSNELASSILPTQAETLPKPPIPIHFNLDTAAFVTLVIDDAEGNRVRNLVSDTWFEKGPNTVWWDGTDDLGRNADAANHGVYLIPTHFVAPGTYHVHGLSHGTIDLHYEFTVYNPGNPPWETTDGKGGWLTNHTPPQATLFVPADRAPGGKPLVYIGSYISEGGAGLAWVDLSGVKQGGRGWIGGAWTGAPYLARDWGSKGDSSIYAYVGAPWGDNAVKSGKPTSGIVRITGLTAGGDKAVINYSYNPGEKFELNDSGGLDWTHQMGGLAVHNGLIVVSLPLQNQLLFVNAGAGKVLGTVPLDKPKGVAFDAQGRLLVLSGKRLLRYVIAPGFNPQQTLSPETLIGDGLEAPQGIALDSSGDIAISDDANSNQVKVFSSAGKLLRAIGHSGPSQAGPYDPLHMNNPAGITIDSENHLWVAEDDFQPKRVSEWTLDGQLVKAFYGPSEYGGGGALDPTDKTRFYYHGMEFKLDWNLGSSAITNILYRPTKDDIAPPRFGQPSTPIYSNGHRYFINSYLGHPVTGASIGMLYLEQGGVLRPVAAMGHANDWPLLKGDPFKQDLPPGADLSSGAPEKSILFAWSDKNENGKVDPDEVQFVKSTTGFVTIMPDETATGANSARGPVMLNAFVDGKAMRYEPVKLSPSGVPSYDLNKGEVIVEGAQRNASDGGGQVLESPTSVVLTTAPEPFAREGVGGVDKQNHRWSYPSLWPGLHPSHSAPLADHAGELIGATRLLGSFFSPAGSTLPGSTVDPLWAINGNQGDIFLFTADGLFVSQLFQDVRTGKLWNMPVASRNMLLNDVTLHDENFFPSITQTSDGKVYIDDGGRTSLVRVDGLGTLRKLPDFPLQVTADDLNKAQGFLKQREASRQVVLGPQVLDVSLRAGPAPALNQMAGAMNSAAWATIDQRITQQGWNQKPDIVEAAITIAGGRLFADFRTNEPMLLANSGAVSNSPFKTGGALDLMIGTDPHADPKRPEPVQGDLRLLVYQVNGRTKATLYRAVVPGIKNPVPFSSPSRTVTLDQVQDVSDSVDLYADNGQFAFSIPLSVLGMKPEPGESIKADIGILRGNGTQTTQRAYWSNKATGITSDVPSEAELTPNLWGTWRFKVAP